MKQLLPHPPALPLPGCLASKDTLMHTAWRIGKEVAVQYTRAKGTPSYLPNLLPTYLPHLHFGLPLTPSHATR